MRRRIDKRTYKPVIPSLLSDAQVRNTAIWYLFVALLTAGYLTYLWFSWKPCIGICYHLY